MAVNWLEIIKGLYALNHERILRAVADLTDAQLSWRPSAASHSIAFELWHVARSNDVFAVELAQMAPTLREKIGAEPEIWYEEDLARRWEMDPAALGPQQAGTGMTDDAAAALQFPPKAALLDYARRAFARCQRAVTAVDEQEFVTISPGHPFFGDQAIGWHVLFHLGHDDWTLGYIAALRRAQNLPRVEA